MMTSFAKAISQSGNAANQIDTINNNNSLFLMLLTDMMGMDPSNSMQNLFSGQNQLLSPLASSYNPLNFQQSLLESQSVTTSQTGDFSFKPTQFIKLENSLEGKLSGTAMHFINAGKQYDIDPSLLAAIAIHETGNGSSKAVHEKLNVAGMMGKDGLRSYSSLEESIFDMARNLRENYLNKGKSTIAAIGAKYAPIGASNDPTGLNNHWVNGVSKFYNNLA